MAKEKDDDVESGYWKFTPACVMTFQPRPSASTKIVNTNYSANYGSNDGLITVAALYAVQARRSF